MGLSFEFDQESDGRWIAEIPELPGALAYGLTQGEAVAKAEAIAARILEAHPWRSVPRLAVSFSRKERATSFNSCFHIRWLRLPYFLPMRSFLIWDEVAGRTLRKL
jgi:predicted RNase H-like HicB family nuclease